MATRTDADTDQVKALRDLAFRDLRLRGWPDHEIATVLKCSLRTLQRGARALQAAIARVEDEPL